MLLTHGSSLTKRTLDYVLSADEVVIDVESVKVSPNPTSTDALLTLTLEETSDVSIELVDVYWEVNNKF